jgi:hypothetical protein
MGLNIFVPQSRRNSWEAIKMPTPNQQVVRPRRAAYSVTETAKLCDLSRARFYDLIRDCVMPMPNYCIYTRKPLYTADVAALCVRVRETNTGIDGRYVIFYARREKAPGTAVPPAVRSAQRSTPIDTLTQEMIETLRAMGVRQGQAEVVAAINARCPSGVTESSFETDLRAVFDRLRSSDRE